VVSADAFHPLGDGCESCGLDRGMLDAREDDDWDENEDNPDLYDFDQVVGDDTESG
jgi:hypothetical protein